MRISLELNTEELSPEQNNALGILLNLSATSEEAEEAEKPKLRKAEAKRESTNDTPEKVVDASEEQVKGITLEALRERAKEKVASGSKAKVQATIREFAPKLSEMDEADYGKLYKKLGAL